MRTKKSTQVQITATVTERKYKGSMVIKEEGEMYFTPWRTTGNARYELIHRRGDDKIEKVGEKGARIKMTVYAKTSCCNPYADLMASAQKLLQCEMPMPIVPGSGLLLAKTDNCECCILPDDMMQVVITEPLKSGKNYTSRMAGKMANLMTKLILKEKDIREGEKRAALRLAAEEQAAKINAYGTATC